MATTLQNWVYRSAGPNNGSGAQYTLQTGSLTVYPGDVLVLKTSAQSPSLVIGSGLPTTTNAPAGGTALAWTLRSTNTAASSCPMKIFTCTVPTDWPAAGQAVQINQLIQNNYANNTNGYFHQVLERHLGTLAATPAVYNNGTTTIPTGQMSVSMSGLTAGSTITWMAADYNGVGTAGTGTANSAVSGGTISVAFQTGSAILSSYAGYSADGTGTTRTIGMATPTGQKDTIAAIEIIPPPTKNASGYGQGPTLAATVKGTGTSKKVNPVDSLQRRAQDELAAFYGWLNGSKGYLGEFGWVTNLPADQALYNAWADQYMTLADSYELRWTAWASGRQWGTGYPLYLHASTTVDTDLNSTSAGAASLAGHMNNGWAHGVNLAGLENGVQYAGGGTVRTASPYVPTQADCNYLYAAGLRFVRLPIAWERIQPTLLAALDTTFLSTLDTVLTRLRTAGISWVLEVHNYGRYTAVDGSVYAMVESGSNLNISHLVDLWTRISTWILADSYRSGWTHSYGIMNEPHDLAASGTRAPWQVWEYATRQAVTAIRNNGDSHICHVSLYNTSQMTRAAESHPNGPWLTDLTSISYEGHHYSDTTSKLGSRSGTFQEDNGSGGVRIMRYATELAAAVEQYTVNAPGFGSLKEDWTLGVRRAAGQPWAQTNSGTTAPAVVTAADGYPAVQITAYAGNQYSGVRTDYVFRLAPGRIRVKVPRVLALGGGAAVETRLIVDAPTSVVAGGTRFVITMKAQTGNLEFRNESGYYEASPTTQVYDPVVHLWWGFRADDATLYLESSPDGFTWTTQRTLTAPAWLKTTQLRLTMEATRDAGTTDTAQFGAVNLTTAPSKSGYGNAGVLPLGAPKGVSGGIQVSGNGLAPASGFTYNVLGTGVRGPRGGFGQALASGFTYSSQGVRSGIVKAGNGRGIGWTDLQRAVGAKAIVGMRNRQTDATLALAATGTGMQVRPGFGNGGVLPLGVPKATGQHRGAGTGVQPALAWGNPRATAGAVTRGGTGQVTPLALGAQARNQGRLATGNGQAPASGFSYAQRATGQKRISQFVRASDVTLAMTTRARGTNNRTGGARALASGFAWNTRGYFSAQKRNGQATAYGLQNYARSLGPKNIFGRGQPQFYLLYGLSFTGKARGYRAMYGRGAGTGLNLSASGCRPAEIPDFFPYTRPEIARPFRQEDIRIIAQHVRTREYLHTFVPLTGAKLKVKISGATEITGSIKPEIASLKGADGRPLFKDWSTLLHFEIDGELWGTGILQPMSANGPELSVTAVGLSTYPEKIPYLENFSKVNIDAFDVLAEGWRYVQNFPNAQLGIRPVRTTGRLANRLGLEPKEIIDSGIQRDDNGDPIAADMTKTHYADNGHQEPKWRFMVEVLKWPWYWDNKDTPQAVGALDAPKAILDWAEKGVLPDLVTGRARQVPVNKSDVPQNVWDSLVYLGYAGPGDNSTVIGDNIRVSVMKQQFKPWEMLGYEGPMVGAKINEVLKAAQLDYLETTKWSDPVRSDTVQNVSAVYPRVGDIRPQCRFVQGENILSAVDPAQQADFGASAMWGVGNGDGKDAIRGILEDLSDPDRIRRVGTYKNSRIKDPTLLGSLLKGQLAARKETLEIPSITVALFHRNAKLGEYWLGDDILVQAETRWWGWVALWHRILEIEIDPTAQTGVLTLRRSDAFLYGQLADTGDAGGASM